jgi:23S rRNA pseudoU1915 N3-methylase RlmH
MNKNRLIVLCFLVTFLVSPLAAQAPAAANAAVQERVAALKQGMVKNKQQLAQYTWVETVTISLKGEQKKQERSQVRMGPDGKPQKTPLDQAAAAAPQPAAAPSGRRGGGRVKEHVVAKKKEEYKDYADNLKSLAQRYVPPDKDLLQKAQQAGNISAGPGTADTQVQLVIHDYVKPNDSMTIVLDKAQKQLVSMQVASYLDDAKDKMNLSVNFANLPDGTNHVDSTVLEGVSKQLKVAIQNSNYQKL